MTNKVQVLLYKIFAVIVLTMLVMVELSKAQTQKGGCTTGDRKCVDLMKPPPVRCFVKVQITDKAQQIMTATKIVREGNILWFEKMIDKKGDTLFVDMWGPPENRNKSFSIRAIGKNSLEITIVECDGDEMRHTVKNGVLNTKEE